MSDTRGRILDALEDVLAEFGHGGATLEAVAARAGVSKGGLLYHFGTKEALYSGLLDRLRGLGEADADVVEGAPIVDSYLATSSVAAYEFTRSLMAALRLVGVPGIDAAGAIVAALDPWARVLTREISDPLVARLITLVGDGLYLRALLGATPDPMDAELAPYLEALILARDPDRQD